MRKRIWPAAFVAVTAAGACKNVTDTGFVCLGLAMPAVSVEVRDSVTGEPAAFGVTSEVTDDGFSDSLRVIGWAGEPGPATAYLMGAAYERPGTYAVRIDKPGYRTWRMTGARVTRTRCGVRTAELVARLQKAP